ncbi:Exodeoxyribonuclease III [Candidatus Profftia lariciata]|uniref:exodeoxyribonuclease III n=1 Tax=Candidatus Profftia lariciata TaxID=1987921 RepID=UPI001D006AA3|nr:exodeoxyribonuclease III [Candidatus Profftia lariciata]UDG81444.1 Exodeoxyribonuclease III [Candidatus Profftia lariciata]
MKCISFNINGLRAHIHQLKAIISKYQPDIIGLQEIKVHDDMFPLNDLKHLGYYMFYHGQKKYYGVALLSKKYPISVIKGFAHDKEDAQRRIITANFLTPVGILTIINGYFPQGENRNNHIKFSTKQKFYQDLCNYLKLEQTPIGQLIIMGDMNISPTDNDIGIGEKQRKRWLLHGKCSFLPEERQWMHSLMQWGLIDTYRQLYPKCNDKFSWFDYRSKGFDKNNGLRIDLILASKSLAQCCINAGIDYDIHNMEKPSDHAPIWAEFQML